MTKQTELNVKNNFEIEKLNRFIVVFLLIVFQLQDSSFFIKSAIN